ncbi:LacI family DNA-binding transcriptional regulator [Maribellus comscasis]|uniref:LacI family DNA-binding transcriptional regulator n=1 Tax=Maribellus comscasis TaxID=2681766 RepID=A0A6I6JXD7_9BACT|nr:LacI family DNA-binding transcriptional regulator [Maribellus comscasis]QGY47826.1 LacI family DNA-binding transcriptional regulator [Maribellus comscasis]
MSVTIKDIAAFVGVSYSTVSLVLNGKASENRISEELERKIFAAAKELNYRPNTLARGLRKGITNSIGFVISDISNAFFVKLARRVEKEAMRSGYRVFFASSDENDDKCIEVIDSFLNQRVDGLILIPTQGIHEKLNQLSSQQIPFVLVDRHFPKINANCVVMNNWQSAYDATVYLIKKGKRRIGTFSYDTNFFHMAERLEGYKAALKDNGIRFDKRLVPEVPFWDDIKTNTLLKDYMPYLVDKLKIDSVFFPTNSTALPGIQILYDQYIKKGKDISVICFDDNDFFKVLQPPVTSLIQPIEEIGVESVRILIDEIKNKRTNKMKNKIVYSAQLVDRGS